MEKMASAAEIRMAKKSGLKAPAVATATSKTKVNESATPRQIGPEAPRLFHKITSRSFLLQDEAG